VLSTRPRRPQAGRGLTLQCLSGKKEAPAKCGADRRRKHYGVSLLIVEPQQPTACRACSKSNLRLRLIPDLAGRGNASATAAQCAQADSRTAIRNNRATPKSKQLSQAMASKSSSSSRVDGDSDMHCRSFAKMTCAGRYPWYFKARKRDRRIPVPVNRAPRCPTRRSPSPGHPQTLICTIFLPNDKEPLTKAIAWPHTPRRSWGTSRLRRCSASQEILCVPHQSLDPMS
jgi:hypothetical protein